MLPETHLPAISEPSACPSARLLSNMPCAARKAAFAACRRSIQVSKGSCRSHMMLTVPCPACSARRKLRVRKELRSLSRSEKEMFVRALAVMLSIPTEAGQRLYGPK